MVERNGGIHVKGKPKIDNKTVYKTPEQEFVEAALADLDKYIAGKYSIDAKATDNQEWWRLRHMDYSPDAAEEPVDKRSNSAWAVNSILNKHADIMDSFPKPNVLPREADDEPEAEILSNILPVTLEQNDYEQRYRDMAWDFAIDGGAITGVFWNNNKADGLGDIEISNVDVHNLFWQPGVNELQKSARLFHVSLEDVDAVKMRYPQIADKIGPQNMGRITEYLHDDNIDTSNCVEVINMYYRKHVIVETPVGAVDEDGNELTIPTPKTLLHLAIIVGDQLAFCSEFEPGYEEGFYHHGKYPFVIRRGFPIKDTPWGFGYLDIMKAPQMYIDALDKDIIKIADMKARPRALVKKNANISKDQFADWSQELIEVGAGDLHDSFQWLDTPDNPTGAMEIRMNKIDELKETSGNRDFSQGSTQGSVTAASAIAALQEAGSKLSRDMNKELYRGAREEYYLVIELMRQFYSEPRAFRITGDNGDYRFVQYSNAGIVDHDMMMPDGTIRHRRPIFDIQVSAEKQSPFSRAAQNELVKELYGMGMFDPNNDVAALACIDAMDFEGKDKIKQTIQQNGVMIRQFQAAMQLIQQMAIIDPAIAQMAMQMGLIDPMMMDQMMAQQAGPKGGQQSRDSSGTPEERAARATTGGDNSQAAKARVRAASAAQPK